jgi:hypothetical protein
MSNQANRGLNFSNSEENTENSNLYVSNDDANDNVLANNIGALRISSKPPKTANNRNRVWITNKNYWAHPNSENSKRMKLLHGTPKNMNLRANNNNNNNNNSNNGLGHSSARPYKKIKMNRKTRKMNRKQRKTRKANRKQRKN